MNLLLSQNRIRSRFFHRCTLFACMVGIASAAAAGVFHPPSDDFRYPDGCEPLLVLAAGDEVSTACGEGVVLSVSSSRCCLQPPAEARAGWAWFDTYRIMSTVSGLQKDKAYFLALYWWDADSQGRLQSVQFRQHDGQPWETVLPSAPAAAFSNDKPVPAMTILPVPQEFAACGSFSFSVGGHAGAGAVLQACAVLSKTPQENQKKVLLITGDDYPGHDWQKTSRVLAEELRKDQRLELSVTESPATVGSPLLSYYDAVVVHFKNYDDRLLLDAAVGEAFQRYVASGKGVVFTHFSCGAFQNWAPFEKIAGRIWNPSLRGHDPYGEFTVRMTGSSHPVVASMHDFTTRDELYTCLEGTVPITVLCDAVSCVDQKVYPMAFVVENTGGRVFHCLLGHDPHAYRNAAVADLYRNAVCWVSGLLENP